MQANRIRMRHLRCFLAVARAGSVTRAAEDLGTVQPSVSRTIRELEEEVGAPLFDRSPTGLDLNSAGQTLHAHVSNGLAQVDWGIEALQSRLLDRRLVVFALPNVVRKVMPGAVRRFKRDSPGVDLEIETITGGMFTDRMRRGDVDFAVGRLNAAGKMEALTYEPLYEEPLVFFTRAGHPLAGRQKLTAAEVDEFEVLLPSPGTIVREEIDRFLIGHGLTRFRDVMVTLSFEFARAYMLMSDAVACQPLGAMQQELDAGEVVRIGFGEGQMIGSVGLYTPAAKPAGPQARQLMQAIREEVAALGLS